MPLRILMQLAIVALPFGLFGLYLLLTTAAEEEGFRKWPIKMLFGVGVLLSAAVWVFLIFTEDKDGEMCVRASYTDENGRIIPSSEYPCERDLSTGSQRLGDRGADADTDEN